MNQMQSIEQWVSGGGEGGGTGSLDDLQRGAQELARTASGALQDLGRTASDGLPSAESRDTMWRRPKIGRAHV